MKQATFLIVLLAHILKMEAQPRVVSGFVKDFRSGEVLIGATVYCPQTKAGCITMNLICLMNYGYRVWNEKLLSPLLLYYYKKV